jgi:thymidine phosphorylase
MITGSILSKKLSAGLDALVMDVKVGSGAFMPTYEKSVELAESIVKRRQRRRHPHLGHPDRHERVAVPGAGNAVEVRVAIDYLTGKSRPARLHEVTMALCAEMLVIWAAWPPTSRSARQAAGALDSGEAAERFARMVAALGGPADLMDKPDVPGKGADHRAGAGAGIRLRRSRPTAAASAWPWCRLGGGRAVRRTDRLRRRPDRPGRTGRQDRRRPAAGDGPRAHAGSRRAGRAPGAGGYQIGAESRRSRIYKTIRPPMIYRTIRPE